MGAEKTSIINIEFASGDETNAEFHAEVILDVRSNAVSRRADAETTIEIGEESKVISIPVNWTDDGKTILKALQLYQQETDSVKQDAGRYRKRR